MNDISEELRGAAALMEMLGMIGLEGVVDLDVTKVLVDNEMELRSLLTFAIHHFEA